MPIEFSCSQCLASIRVPDSAGGKQAQCPSCGGVSPVPMAGYPTPPVAAPAQPPVTSESPFKEGFAGPADGNPFGAGNPFGDTGLPAANHPYAPPANYGNFMQPGEMAERGNRLLAKILDSLILAGPTLLGFAVAAAVAGGEPSDEILMVFGGVGGLLSLIIGIYNMYLTASFGETIGKRMMSMRIVNEANGQPPGFVSGVLVRSWVMALLSQCVPFIGLIDVLFIFGEKHQCLHDMMASTRVVKGRYSDVR